MGHRKLSKSRRIGSIRDEVEKLAMKDAYNAKHDKEETKPSLSTNDESSRLVAYWLNSGRKCNLVHKLSDMDWSTILLNYLQTEKVTYSSTVQSCMWPALTKLQSVVCVAGSRQGKTIGWVLPLLNTLLDTELYEHLRRGAGPRVVVLCPGHVAAGNVRDALERVVSGSGLDLKISSAFTGDDKSVDLVNGCDVLVISPPKLVQLVRKGITTLDRCCHLIMEDAHINLRIHQQDIVEALVEWRRLRTDNLNLVPDQVMVVGEEWSTALQEFTEKFLMLRWKPTLVFGSMLEAVVYNQLPIVSLYHHDNLEKLNSVLRILKGPVSFMRPVIVCTKNSVSLNIFTLLSMEGIIPVVLRKGEFDDIVDLTNSLSVWLHSSTGVPLLVSDDILLSLPNIPGCADCLIHWDIPLASKKMFSIRFLFVKDTLQQGLEEGNTMTANVHLLLSEEDNHSFLTLSPLLRRCGAEIPSEMVIKVANLKHGSGNLCERMIEGRTDCSPLCSKRHWLDRVIDQEQVEEKKLEGVIEFMVIRVETPVHYWVRVMDCVYDRDFQRRAIQMAIYFSSAVARIPISVGELKIGLTVAVDGDDDVYHRAKVLGFEFKEYKDQDKLVGVTVFLVDMGKTESYHPNRICKLPESLGLGKFTAGATAVTVSGILPPDNDPDWSLECAELVAGYLTPLHGIDREEVCRARVLLHTSTMLWVDRCQLMVKQPTIGRFVLHFETYSWLVSQHWAVPNHAHNKHLINVAGKGGLYLPKCNSREELDHIEDDINNSQAEFKDTSLTCLQLPRTAHLTLSSMVKVVVSECVTPDKFYVQLVSNLPSLARMQQDIADWADQHPRHLLAPVIGQIVLVRVEEDTWYSRAQITHVTEVVTVYLVDTGEVANILLEDTLPCPDFLSYKIPHQAIQCSLHDVQPVSGSYDWDRKAGDVLYDLSRDPLTDLPVTLICHVCQVTSTGYNVRLTNTNTSFDVDLATELVSAGLAEKIKEEFIKADICETSMELIGDTPTNMFNLELLAEGAFDLPGVETESVQVKNYSHALVTSNLIQKEEPSPILPNPTIPVDMPSLAIVKDTTNYTTQVPRIKWWQTASSVNISVEVMTIRDIESPQVHVRVTEDKLVVQVMEHCLDSIVLHVLPGSHLPLWGKTVPCSTKVRVMPRMVAIQLDKYDRGVDWHRLALSKYEWIKRDMQLQCLENDSKQMPEDHQIRKSKEEKLHSHTKQGALAEELFDILDEEDENSSSLEEEYDVI